MNNKSDDETAVPVVQIVPGSANPRIRGRTLTFSKNWNRPTRRVTQSMYFGTFNELVNIIAPGKTHELSLMSYYGFHE